MIGAVLIGIDGITDGNEIRFFLAGIGLIAIIGIDAYTRPFKLASIWDHSRGGWYEYQFTTFDISEEAILKIHEVLNQDYPGIERYGKYWTQGEDRKTTERATVGGKVDWANQRGKRLMTVTFEWKQKNAKLVVAYGRAPAQIWAARIIDTVGISDEAHEKITKKLDGEEWRIRPRYRWICGLVWRGWMLGTLVVSAMLWGGVEVFIGPNAPFPRGENVLAVCPYRSSSRDCDSVGRDLSNRSTVSLFPKRGIENRGRRNRTETKGRSTKRYRSMDERTSHRRVGVSVFLGNATTDSSMSRC